MNRPARSYTHRVTRNFALLATATTATVLTLVGWMLANEGRRSLEVLHDGEFSELSQMIRSEPGLRGEEIGRRIGQDTANDAGLYFTQIHDRDGNILFRSANLGAVVLPNLKGSGVRETVELPTFGAVRISAYSADGYHYEIASALGPLNQLLEEYVRIALILFCVVAAGSVALGRAFAAITLRPIRAIRETAGRIGADNLGERIPVPPSRDEFSSLVELLNRMFDRLEAAFHQSRRFTADASHELKTPLALIRLHAERLRPAVAPDAAASAHLDDLFEEIEHLQRILESLLFLAKAESGTLAVPMRRCDTPALVESLAEDAAVLADEKGVRFEVTRNAPCCVTCDPTLVHQLLLNLITNAVRVSPRQGRITLDSRLEDARWVVEIADEGPGLPAEKLARIFERFFSYEPTAGTGGAEKATSLDPVSSQRGQGLGLAIAQGIATLHRGSLQASNRADRTGLCVRVELPGERSVAGVK